MDRIKKGDVVGRISYGKDILFTVENILKRSDGRKVAILKGLILRIEADADLSDLVLIEKKQVENNMRSLENKIEDKIKRCVKRRVYDTTIGKENFSGEAKKNKMERFYT